MKKIILVLLMFFITITLTSQIKKLDVSKCLVTWKGKKVTGEHIGILKFKEGNLIIKNKKVIGGVFVIDMTTLSNTDQSGSDKEKLEGHLKSVDFFDTEGFKTSKLIIKSATEKKKNLYKVIADLSIKGKTNSVNFDLIVNGKTATADLVIDRTKFGIQYGSGSFFDDLGDRTIYDEFDLNVKLQF